MTFLLSRPKDDTTVAVIQWLQQKGKKFFRMNTIDDINVLYHSIPGDIAYFEDYRGKRVSLGSINSYYFHGGSIIIPIRGADEIELTMQISKWKQQEATALFRFIFNNIEEKRGFGLSPFSSIIINKLNVLQIAKKEGLNIPPSSIVSDKKKLKSLKSKWGRIINKSIDDGIYIETEKILINGQRTVEVIEGDIESIAETFFPSLVQKLIEKIYEIRVFYFRNRFYSIAIFTQNNKESKIDGREKNIQKPNREVPYSLPKEMEDKLCCFMNKLNLNYGSIDLIYSTDNNYYFLEVNPYGQYGFLSSSGNYYLEKEIAEYL